MPHNVFVPFEPGINADPTLTATPLYARRVQRVPDVSAVRDAQADAWFTSPALDNLLDLHTHSPGDPATRVVLMWDEQDLFVAFDCVETEPSGVRRLIPADAENGTLRIYEKSIPRVLDHDDHVAVAIDPKHDHATVHWLRTNINGARRTTAERCAMSWSAVPVSSTPDNTPTPQWDSAVVERPGGWRAAMRLRLSSLGIDPARQPTIGIHLARARYGTWLQHFASTGTLPGSSAAPLAMADLYFHGPQAAVRSITWVERAYGDNRISVEVLGGTEPREVRVSATLSHATGRSDENQSPPVRLEPHMTVPVNLSYSMPHNYERASLTLEVRDAASGRAYYRGHFPLGSHTDLNVDNPHPASAANPHPGDSNFHEKKRNYILSRLPRFCRKTTAQGAPSDFTLASTDGSVVFNLMESGVMGKIGRWLDSLFDNAIDRIVAAALFSNDNWVTTHCAARVGMHEQLTALSCLRLGSGHCYSRAVAGAGIASAMTDPRTGKHFEAYPVLVLGHVVVAVRWRDSWTLFDPSFGHFFFNRDNTDLATDVELEADPDLIRRVGLSDARLRNYGRRDVHVRLREGPIVWPAGAPPR